MKVSHVLKLNSIRNEEKDLLSEKLFEICDCNVNPFDVSARYIVFFNASW